MIDWPRFGFRRKPKNDPALRSVTAVRPAVSSAVSPGEVPAVVGTRGSGLQGAPFGAMAPSAASQAALGARVLCIASGKGGTGKSITATNLAAARAARGEDVLLIDFDAGLANAHLLLGVSPRFDLGHVMEGSVLAHQAKVRGRASNGTPGFDLLSGGVGRDALANPSHRELERLFRALEAIERQYDLVIVDHGAGLGLGVLAHLAATSTLMIVTGHEITALSDGYALYKRAVHVNPSIRAGLVVNRVPDEQRAQAAWERFRSVSQKFLGREPEYLGFVPADEAVARSIEERRPVVLGEPESPSGRAFHRIAEWSALDLARTPTAFYERARRALR